MRTATCERVNYEFFGVQRASRKVLVVLYFTIILAVLASFGIVTIPAIITEGADFMRRLQQENAWSVLLTDVREGLG